MAVATLAMLGWSMLSLSTSEPQPPARSTRSLIVDSAKFESLYRSAKAVEGAQAVGVSYVRFGEFLQAFATEVSIARDKAASAEERRMVGAYADALATLQDSLALWRAQFDTKAKQTAEQVAARYSRWFSEQELLQKVWSVALSQMEAANKMYLSDFQAGAVVLRDLAARLEVETKLREEEKRLQEATGVKDAAAVLAAFETEIVSPRALTRLAAVHRVIPLKGWAKPAVPRLVVALQDSSWDVRASAATALGEIGPAAAEALDALAAAANDPKSGIVESAQEAIKKIRGR